MKLLLDTHLLLWAASTPGRISTEGQSLINDVANSLYFSAASVWEVAIKAGLKHADFTVQPTLLHRGLLDNGYIELAVTSQHATAVYGLPEIHKDPFDRLLVAQAVTEGLTLLTSDKLVAKYHGSIRLL